MIRFAMNVYGRFSVNYSSRNMDNLLVGWRFSAPTLGLYKKAYDLFALSGSIFVSSLTTVAVSALSRFDRDSVQFRRNFLSALAVIAFVGMGLGADLTLVGRDVIRLLLGKGWEESGRIFVFFGPGIGAMLLYGTHAWIHLSIGRPERWLRWGLVEFAFTGLLFLLALPWGPPGIAAAWTASFWILTVPALWYAGRPIHLGVFPMMGVIWKYIVASALAGCACAGVTRLLPSFVGLPESLGAFARIVTISGLFGTMYLTSVILLHRGCAPLFQVAGLAREMVPWRGLSKPSALVPQFATVVEARDSASATDQY